MGRSSLHNPLARLPWSLFIFSVLASASSDGSRAPEKVLSYKSGQAISVSCLNRTIDTGEHITDGQGNLQYIPFFTCNETDRPLELYFGVEQEMNCTLPALSDPLYHLLEFYIHNDAPLTCRIPSHPLSPSSVLPSAVTTDDYVALVFALSGTLQLSHLHINPLLNVVLHTSPDLIGQDADILSATAYSSPSLSSASEKVVIGDPLLLQLSVKWYSNPSLPPSTTQSTGLGGHVHLSTVFYCLLSCGVGVAGSLAYFRGVDMPRRLRRYGKDKVGGERGLGMGGGYAFPGSGMVGINGFGGGSIGKRD